MKCEICGQDVTPLCQSAVCWHCASVMHSNLWSFLNTKCHFVSLLWPDHYDHLMIFNSPDLLFVFPVGQPLCEHWSTPTGLPVAGVHDFYLATLNNLHLFSHYTFIRGGVSSASQLLLWTEASFEADILLNRIYQQWIFLFICHSCVISKVLWGKSNDFIVLDIHAVQLLS